LNSPIVRGTLSLFAGRMTYVRGVPSIYTLVSNIGCCPGPRLGSKLDFGSVHEYNEILKADPGASIGMNDFTVGSSK